MLVGSAEVGAAGNSTENSPAADAVALKSPPRNETLIDAPGASEPASVRGTSCCNTMCEPQKEGSVMAAEKVRGEVRRRIRGYIAHNATTVGFPSISTSTTYSPLDHYYYTSLVLVVGTSTTLSTSSR
jgi:hypothetical protein